MSSNKSMENRSESLKSTFMRWRLNLFPAYFSTGTRVTFLSSDYQEVHVNIPYNWRTRDNNGELFKGTQYAAVDPIYPMILNRTLGDEFQVHDEESTIRFVEPCEEPLMGKFEITNQELERIQEELNHHESVVRIYKVDLKGTDGTVYTEVEKTFSITKQAP